MHLRSRQRTLLLEISSIAKAYPRAIVGQSRSLVALRSITRNLDPPYHHRHGEKCIQLSLVGVDFTR